MMIKMARKAPVHLFDVYQVVVVSSGHKCCLSTLLNCQLVHQWKIMKKYRLGECFIHVYSKFLKRLVYVFRHLDRESLKNFIVFTIWVSKNISSYLLVMVIVWVITIIIIIKARTVVFTFLGFSFFWESQRNISFNQITKQKLTCCSTHLYMEHGCPVSAQLSC